LRRIGIDHARRLDDGRFAQARPHHRHAARIVIRHIGSKGCAAADQEIDDMFAQRIIIGVAVQIDAARRELGR
jgi:hypothetical protein